MMRRRHFIRRAAATAAAIGTAPGIARAVSPNAKIRVACVGVGGMGANNLRNVASHDAVEVTALCDVDDRFLGPAAAKHPRAVTSKDWREMLGEHQDRFDAVIIATPDHMHAAPAVTAIRGQKHVYLQKPMAATLHECRVITEEAARAGVVTQLGNQGRSSVESRLTVGLLRGGAIGKVREVILWENKPLNWWPKNTELRAAGDPIPDGLDWDLWLGVRPERPYLADTYHPKTWRAWFDFGVGEMGDMGCHHFDTSFDALGLSAPLRVRQTTPGSDGPLWGERRVVEMIFPGTAWTAGDTVRLTWYDGGIEVDRDDLRLPEGIASLPESGTYWIGEHGAIFKNYRGGWPVVIRDDGFSPEEYPQDPEPRNHYHDWVDAMASGGRACADFAHGGPLSETVLVGAMADRFAGQWLTWDRDRLEFEGHPQANRWLRREYRDGWRVEGLG